MSTRESSVQGTIIADVLQIARLPPSNHVKRLKDALRQTCFRQRYTKLVNSLHRVNAGRQNAKEKLENGASWSLVQNV